MRAGSCPGGIPTIRRSRHALAARRARSCAAVSGGNPASNCRAPRRCPHVPGRVPSRSRVRVERRRGAGVAFGMERTMPATMERPRPDRQIVARTPVRSRADWRVVAEPPMRIIFRRNPFADVQAPHGLARDRRSPASTSTRANAADGVGPRPSPSREGTDVRDHCSSGAFPLQSARASRTLREACRPELTVATDAAPFNGSVWLPCAGTFRQGNASAHGLPWIQPRRERPRRGRILNSPGYARRPAQCPAPGCRYLLHRHDSTTALLQEEDPWIPLLLNDRRPISPTVQRVSAGRTLAVS